MNVNSPNRSKKNSSALAIKTIALNNYNSFLIKLIFLIKLMLYGDIFML